MKNKIVKALSLILLSSGVFITYRSFNRVSPTSFADQVHESHNWMWERIRQCDQDTDCILVGGPCGEEIGINRSLETETKSFFRELMPAIDCPTLESNRPKPISTVCINHFCTEVFAQPGNPADAATSRPHR